MSTISSWLRCKEQFEQEFTGSLFHLYPIPIEVWTSVARFFILGGFTHRLQNDKHSLLILESVTNVLVSQLTDEDLKDML